jgi:hypothetical protein
VVRAGQSPAAPHAILNLGQAFARVTDSTLTAIGTIFAYRPT